MLEVSHSNLHDIPASYGRVCVVGVEKGGCSEMLLTLVTSSPPVSLDLMVRDS